MSDERSEKGASGSVPDYSDERTTVAELKEEVRKFVSARRWEVFHTPKNLASSLAIEVGELMEHFQWLTGDESQQVIEDPTRMQGIREEMSDCMAYLLALANVLGVDISSAFVEKMVRNAEKYPEPPPGLPPSPRPYRGER